MPDTKLSGLTKITSACSVDLVYLAHDPAGIIISTGISASSLFQSIPGTTGLVIGGDTNLYRSGSNVLRTDDVFRAFQYTCEYGSTILFTSTLTYPEILISDWDGTYYDHLHIHVPSDTNHGGILLSSGGYLWFGDNMGTNYDANLYRYAPNWLITDSNLVVRGQLCLGASDDTFLYRGGANQLATDDSFFSATLYSTGDVGGVASTVSITNVVNESISTGVGSIKTAGTTARTNTGWLKINNGTSARYIPYFTTITG